MSENSHSAFEPVKRFFHENIQAKTEVSGGAWDPKSNTYSIVDLDGGIITEYKIWKARVETGLGGKVHTYKDIKDPETGEMKKTEVTFDDLKGEWVKKNAAATAAGNIPNRVNTQFMATLNGVKTPDNSSGTYTLIVEPTKWKSSNIDFAVPLGTIGDAPVVLRSGNFGKSK